MLLHAIQGNITNKVDDAWAKDTEWLLNLNYRYERRENAASDLTANYPTQYLAVTITFSLLYVIFVMKTDSSTLQENNETLK